MTVVMPICRTIYFDPMEYEPITSRSETMHFSIEPSEKDNEMLVVPDEPIYTNVSLQGLINVGSAEHALWVPANQTARACRRTSKGLTIMAQMSHCGSASEDNKFLKPPIECYGPKRISVRFSSVFSPDLLIHHDLEGEFDASSVDEAGRSDNSPTDEVQVKSSNSAIELLNRLRKRRKHARRRGQ